MFPLAVLLTHLYQKDGSPVRVMSIRMNDYLFLGFTGRVGVGGGGARLCRDALVMSQEIRTQPCRKAI